MSPTVLILAAVLALAVGVWIGLGAPGWPFKPPAGRRHRNTRPINPIQWGKTSHSTRRR